jgi:hypothetical protein
MACPSSANENAKQLRYCAMKLRTLRASEPVRPGPIGISHSGSSGATVVGPGPAASKAPNSYGVSGGGTLSPDVDGPSPLVNTAAAEVMCPSVVAC